MTWPLRLGQPSPAPFLSFDLHINSTLPTLGHKYTSKDLTDVLAWPWQETLENITKSGARWHTSSPGKVFPSARGSSRFLGTSAES